MIPRLTSAYGLVAVIAWRLATGHFAWAMARGVARSSWCDHCYVNPATHHIRSPDGGQWAGGLVLGLIVACVWPLALVFAVQTPVAIGAEAEERNAAKDRRIRELEKELELSA